MRKKQRKWPKQVLKILFVMVALFAASRVYFRATDDFRYGNIVYEMPYHAEWQIPLPSNQEEEHLNRILSQEFHYLGKGAQCYAFTSQDGEYVLKFFKFKHLKPSWFVNMLPSIYPFKEYKENLAIRKKRKLLGVFEGYRVAYALDKEESGLVFIQLNTSNNPKRSVTIRDKIGLRRTINLQDVVFVLQKKGQTLRHVMTELLNRGDKETAKKRIEQIFDLYASEYRKGIYDRDHGVMHNTGFIGQNPFHLDIGKLTKNDLMKRPEVSKKDLELVAKKINLWIERNYPEDTSLFSEFIEDKLLSLYKERSSLNFSEL